jgi:hypothetical protein
MAMPFGALNAQDILSAGEGFSIFIEDDISDPEPTLPNWFATGILDFTFGKRYGMTNLADEYYDLGRAAFFLEGEAQNGWKVTASADTGSGEIRDMFKRLDQSDPNVIIQRLRDEGKNAHVTYGDDSKLTDATPSDGRVFLRAKNENVRLTWGNFTTPTGSSKLNTSARKLYGGEVQLKTTTKTKDGRAAGTLTAYRATPETATMRDVLEGTGGSMFFLSRQNVLFGTQRVQVQIVDPVSGAILNTRELSEGTDYRLDSLQGVLVLRAPLASYAETDSILKFDEQPYQRLVVQYEYDPIFSYGKGAGFGWTS